jgi:hypothetical protein
MPFKSKAQQRFMFAQHPKLAKEFASDMTKKELEDLPEKKKKKKTLEAAVERAKAKYGS